MSDQAEVSPADGGVDDGHSSPACLNRQDTPWHRFGGAGMVKGQTQNREGASMNSQDMTNPPGGMSARRVTESPDPNGHLMEQILSRENMRIAWKRVKANKGAAGVDHVTIAAFPDFSRENWSRIREELRKGIYQPLPVKRVEIPKPSGGTRPLGIPTVTDRLIQQAIYQVMLPYFNPDFSEYSFGFRPGKSAHDAVGKVRAYIRKVIAQPMAHFISLGLLLSGPPSVFSRLNRRIRDPYVRLVPPKLFSVGR